MEPIQPQKKGRLQQVKDFIKPPDPTKRIEDAYGILKEVAGFRPVFNIRDLEARRKDLMIAMENLRLIDFEVKTTTKGNRHIKKLKRSATRDAFKLAHMIEMFFSVASMWIRGLSDKGARELSKKVADYLELYSDVGHLASFLPDIYKCSMQLVHLSFQAIDVTNTPAYVISSTPLVITDLKRGGLPRFQSPDLGKKDGEGTGAGAEQEP